MESQTQVLVKKGLLKRFGEYFVNRKYKFGALVALVAMLYWAKQRGWVKRFFEYLLSKAAEKVGERMEKLQKQMEESQRKAEQFAWFVQGFADKVPGLQSVFLKRFCNEDLNLDQLKQALKQKNLTAQEKTKNWQSFSASVLKATLATPVLKSYLGIIWSIREGLLLKRNKQFEGIYERYKDSSKKSISAAIECSKSFILGFSEAMITRTVFSSLKLLEETTSLIDIKLNDKVTIDTLIEKIEAARDRLLQIKTQFEDLPDFIEVNFLRKENTKSHSYYKLQNKNTIEKSYSFKDLKKMLKRVILNWDEKIAVKLHSSLVSYELLRVYDNYGFFAGKENIVNHLLQETNLKSKDKLSTIAEKDEQVEEHSELVGDKEENPQAIYEEGINLESKDFEQNFLILNDLEDIIHQYFKEFIDVISSVNTQILLETAIQYNFKKLNNRLKLVSLTSKENAGEQSFLKLVTYLNKIVEEEFIEKTHVANDSVLYESRAKELFSLINKKELDESALNNPELLAHVSIGEEAKLHSLVQRGSKELLARIYFAEEFQQFWKDRIDEPEEDGKSGAKNEMEDMFGMLARLPQPGVGQGDQPNRMMIGQ
jgi:hypothetical protein